MFQASALRGGWWFSVLFTHYLNTLLLNSCSALGLPSPRDTHASGTVWWGRHRNVRETANASWESRGRVACLLTSGSGPSSFLAARIFLSCSPCVTASFPRCGCSAPGAWTHLPASPLGPWPMCSYVACLHCHTPGPGPCQWGNGRDPSSQSGDVLSPSLCTDIKLLKSTLR